MQKGLNILIHSFSIFGVIVLVVVAYSFFIGLTPQTIDNPTLVLGETTQKPLLFAPLKINSAIISDSESFLASVPRGESQFTFTFDKIQNTSYTFPIFQVTNGSDIPQSFLLSTELPQNINSLSLDITIDGITLPLKSGATIMSPSITIDPETISTLELTISSLELIHYPVNLTLRVSPL